VLQIKPRLTAMLATSSDALAHLPVFPPLHGPRSAQIELPQGDDLGADEAHGSLSVSIVDGEGGVDAL